MLLDSGIGLSAIDNSLVLFFFRPNIRPSVDFRVDFFRCGRNGSESLLAIEYLTVLARMVLRFWGLPDAFEVWLSPDRATESVFSSYMTSEGAFPEVRLDEPAAEDWSCLESPSSALTDPGLRGGNSSSMGIGPLIRPRTLLDMEDCARAVSETFLKATMMSRG